MADTIVNEIFVSGPTDVVSALHQELLQAESGALLQAIRPIDESGMSEDEILSTRLNEWGCKWDVHAAISPIEQKGPGAQFSFTFDSDGGAPWAAMRYMSKRFPVEVIHGVYGVEEEAVDVFRFVNGKSEQMHRLRDVNSREDVEKLGALGFGDLADAVWESEYREADMDFYEMNKAVEAVEQSFWKGALESEGIKPTNRNATRLKRHFLDWWFSNRTDDFESGWKNYRESSDFTALVDALKASDENNREILARSEVRSLLRDGFGVMGVYTSEYQKEIKRVMEPLVAEGLVVRRVVRGGGHYWNPDHLSAMRHDDYLDLLADKAMELLGYSNGLSVRQKAALDASALDAALETDSRKVEMQS